MPKNQATLQELELTIKIYEVKLIRLKSQADFLRKQETAQLERSESFSEKGNKNGKSK